MFDSRKYEKVCNLPNESHFLVHYFASEPEPLAPINLSKFASLKGPFEIFSVGGDLSDANVVKFSSDGRLMLLTTSDGKIHVLDSFRGTLVSCFLQVHGNAFMKLVGFMKPILF